MTANVGHCSVGAQMYCYFRISGRPHFSTSPVTIQVSTRQIKGLYFVGIIVWIAIFCIDVLCSEGKHCWKPMLVNTSQDFCGFTNLLMAITSFSCGGSADSLGVDKGSSPDLWVYFTLKPTHVSNLYYLAAHHAPGIVLAGMWQEPQWYLESRALVCLVPDRAYCKVKDRCYSFPFLPCLANPGPDDLPNQHLVDLHVEGALCGYSLFLQPRRLAPWPAAVTHRLFKESLALGCNLRSQGPRTQLKMWPPH